MVIDQDRVGRFQRRLTQEPSAGVLQRLRGDRVDALAHGGKAKIGTVGDQGREQRTVMILGAGLVAGERLEGAREAAPFVHVLQQVLGQRVVARGEAVGRSPGGAQQRMDLGIGQADRLTIAHRAHRPEVAGDIAAQRAGAARPSAQAAQSIQAPVDRGGTSPGGDHVLAVGD